MSFGLQTYNEAGQISSTYDAQMAGVHGFIDILPRGGEPTQRTDSVYLGALSQNPVWFAATAVSNSEPVHHWDMPAFYAWLEGDYLRVYSMSNAHIRITVGRY